MGDARGSYDQIARSYREQFEHELDEKPFDRDFLERVARSMPAAAVVIDVGCGPGQIGRHLSGLGFRVFGADLSLEMLRQAGSDAGRGTYVQADMRSLPFGTGCAQGVVAFYSLIHIPPDGLPVALAEIGRVVAPGGCAAIAVHETQPIERAAPAEPIPGGGLRVSEMLSQPVTSTSGSTACGCSPSCWTMRGSRWTGSRGGIRTPESKPRPVGHTSSHESAPFPASSVCPS